MLLVTDIAWTDWLPEVHGTGRARQQDGPAKPTRIACACGQVRNIGFMGIPRPPGNPHLNHANG